MYCIKINDFLHTAKLVPVGYGIQKLQISCIVEDDKVSTDFLEEEICKFEDLVRKLIDGCYPNNFVVHRSKVWI